MPELTRSPAEIIEQMLVDAGEAWPVFVDNEPSMPDDVITVYNTSGVLRGRLQNTGEQDESFGVQIRIRSADYQTGWEKAQDIKAMLDEEIYLTEVDFVTDKFQVIDFNRSTDVLVLGRETPESQRWVVVINGLTTINQLEV